MTEIIEKLEKMGIIFAGKDPITAGWTFLSVPDDLLPLIAEAPEMLKEIKNLIEVLVDGGFYSEEWKNADAIINRIEGKG